MSGAATSRPARSGQKRQPSSALFDSDGLPWTAHLSLGWIIFLIFMTGGLLAVPIGIYLGLWLKTKGHSALVLAIYSLVACSVVILFLPENQIPSALTDGVSLFAIGLWFVGAFVTRHQVQRHYAECEGSEFHLSLLLTALLSIWYINYRIRPEFPAHSES
jgi:hypothetical protein